MRLRTIAATLQKTLSRYSHVFLENQMVRELFQVNSRRKNSHSFILDWRTSLNFRGGGTNPESHNSPALPPLFDAFLLNKCLKTEYNYISFALLCYATYPIPSQGHGIMHFCGLNYRSLRKERKSWIKKGSEWGRCLAPLHGTQIPDCVGQFFFWKWFVLRQRIVFDHVLHFSPSFLPHWEIQSTPLIPDSSILTCQNPFKSSSLFDTPTWRLLVFTLVQHTNRNCSKRYLLPR